MGLLAKARMYSLLQTMLGAESAREQMVTEYIAPRSGCSILDIGCGPADILGHLSAVEYLGIDHSQRYIEAARARFGTRGTFIQGEIDSMDLDGEKRRFDRVIALGVIHHLNDDQAKKLFAYTAKHLKPDGKLVTIDGCFERSQSRIARFLLNRDRGNHIRTPSAYLKLAQTAFSAPVQHLRRDLINVPYTHCIMECVPD